MRYVWIVMLIIIYVLWLIAVVKDVYEGIGYHYKMFKCLYLEWYSYVFVIMHILALFLYSLYVWRNTL